jgi:hypothetical protein
MEDDNAADPDGIFCPAGRLWWRASAGRLPGPAAPPSNLPRLRCVPSLRDIRGEVYLHHMLLEKADLSTAADRGQLDPWPIEREGMCGV